MRTRFCLGEVRGFVLSFSPFHVFLILLYPVLIGEKEYYEKQFATLRSFEEVDTLDSPHSASEEQDHQQQTQHERAMKISNGANIFLLVFKVIYYFKYFRIMEM